MYGLTKRRSITPGKEQARRAGIDAGHEGCHPENLTVRLCDLGRRAFHVESMAATIQHATMGTEIAAKHAPHELDGGTGVFR